MKKRLVIICAAVLCALTALWACIYYFAVWLPEKKENEELAALFKAHYESRVALFEEENEKFEPGEVDVVFIGDSLTEGYNVAKAFSEYTVVNRGIGGDTSFGLEERLYVSAYALEPKAVVMLIGANNFNTMLENYEDILKGYRDNLPNTKIILLSLTAMSGRWGRNNQKAVSNNVEIKRLAEEYGYEFVDLFTPLKNPESGEIYDEYTTDGGHLTDAGYRVLTENIKPAIKRAIGE